MECYNDKNINRGDVVEFIRVESGNSELIDKVYSILAASGKYMFENMGLSHWLPPYDKERISEDTENKQVYIVKVEDEFVATFTLSDKTSKAFRSIPDDNAVYLSKFAVDPYIMGAGIGSACMKYIEETSKQRNKTKVRFDVYIKSEHAIKFYIKMGYMDAPLPYTNVICMEKNI